MTGTAPASAPFDAVDAALSSYLQWAVRQSFEDIPPAVRQRMVMILADDMAAAFSAANEPEAVRLAAWAAPAAHAPSASLLRRGRPRADLRQAAMVNAVAGGWNELDSGYRLAVCHAGLYTWPTLMALAEAQRAPLPEVLRAAMLAYETVVRFASAWPLASPKLHPHALYGALGAAAAAGFLQRLPVDRLQQVLTAACTMGLTGPFNQAPAGALVRNAWAAAGVANGLLCIEWAEAGIGGLARTPHDLYASVLAAPWRPAAFAPIDAESAWAVNASYHKRYACCQYLHSSIEALLTLLGQAPSLVGGDAVNTLEVRIHPLGMGLTNRAPDNTLAGCFSLPHAMATTLVHGRADALAFSGHALNDPRVAALRGRVHWRAYEPLAAWPHDRPANVTLTLKDGRVLRAECLSAQGGPDHPFTDAMLWDKVRHATHDAAPGFEAAMREWHAAAGKNAAASRHADTLLASFFG
ncbi:MmgE/PrpD family protein [Variovorax boronicumulans]|uniref:MmgE/PrpD family protein n=1 Tax=Variovorax boronicumulans TaxID=436515 RepID=UPI001C59C73A